MSVLSPSVGFMRDEAFKAATTALFADDHLDQQAQEAALTTLGAGGRELRERFVRLMVSYKAGINEVLTKISILSDEFALIHQSNPIEHVTHRLKSPQSMLEKLVRRGVEPSFEAISGQLTDIAGVRVTCSFIADTYRVCDALLAQDDITVLQLKDYIKEPKPNGYRSLHAIVQVPVFLSDGRMPVPVEVQIRTIAMDFWA